MGNPVIGDVAMHCLDRHADFLGKRAWGDFLFREVGAELHNPILTIPVKFVKKESSPIWRW
jgi:hypothetical protein